MLPLRYQSKNAKDVDVFSLAFLRELPQHDPFRPHALGFHIAVFYTDGVGEHWVDGRSYPVQAGTVLFVAPEQLHAFPADPQVEATVVAFTRNALDASHLLSGTLTGTGAFSPWLQGPSVRISAGVESQAKQLLVVMDSETRRQPGSTRQDVLLQLFTGWTLLIGRYDTVTETREQAPGFEELLQFLHVVDVRCGQSRTTEDYARWTGISTRQLRRVC